MTYRFVQAVECQGDVNTLVKMEKKQSDLNQVALYGVQMKSPEVTNSFLERPEGVLHVLQQLGEVSFNLSFTVLHRVLNHKSNIKQSRQSPHFDGSTQGKGGR